MIRFKFKKSLALLLTIISFIVMFAGCGNNYSDNDNVNENKLVLVDYGTISSEYGYLSNQEPIPRFCIFKYESDTNDFNIEHVILDFSFIVPLASFELHRFFISNHQNDSLTFTLYDIETDFTPNQEIMQNESGTIYYQINENGEEIQYKETVKIPSNMFVGDAGTIHVAYEGNIAETYLVDLKPPFHSESTYFYYIIDGDNVKIYDRRNDYYFSEEMGIYGDNVMIYDRRDGIICY
ncbi:MAG: hypothetical protein LBF68_04450 [Christensenellaceae bacterium]|jgi:hypothetical protein|nr:hypothetical protein [Christensenellaceae bacterium]